MATLILFIIFSSNSLSPFCQGAILFLIISIFCDHGLPLNLVHHDNNNNHSPPFPDSTEAVIQRTVEGIRKMISINGSPKAEGGPNEAAVITINPAMKRHFELEIKTLQDAPRDADKLRGLLQIKQRQYQKARQIEDIQNLVTEIEMLRFVLFLIYRNESKEKR